MDASAITSSPAAQTKQTGLAKATNDIVKQEDFFKLLIAQLKNQDPLNPVENQEFIAQLAQFSSLEQQANQTQLLEKLVEKQDGDAAGQALSLIGREVTVENDYIDYQPGDEYRYLFHTEGASNVLVQVTSATGKVIDTQMVSVGEAGQHDFLFDGTLSTGLPLTAGEYKVSFGTQTSADGSQTENASFMLGRVDGVNFLNGEPILMVNGQTVSLASVMAVYESFDEQGLSG